jgi:flagellar hook-associated protein 2
VSSGLLSIDGLISGLNTTDIINQLLEVERIPITRLEERKSRYEQKIALWQEANTKLLALQTAASSLASESTFEGKAVSVSDESVISASATSSAVTGTYLLRVEQIAYAHQIATSSSYADYNTTTFGEGVITIQVGSEDPVEIAIDSSNNTLEGIKNAINSSGAGVSASIVNTSDGYKLLLSSKQTGLDGAITFTSALFGGEATLSGFYDIQPAQNARVSLGTSEGGATPLVYESSSNLIEDLIPGVSLNLKAVSTQSVVLTIEDDLESIKSSIRNFVARFNEFQDFVAENTSFNADTGVAGALLGDTSLQRIQSQILSNLFRRVESSYFQSVAEIGVSVDRYGRLSLDENKLDTALQNNLEEVKKLFTSSVVATDADVEVVNVPSSVESLLEDSSLDIVITQAAEKGRVEASVSLGSDTLGQDETLTFNGSVVVNLTAGMTLDEVVATINSTLEANGVLVEARNEGGKLVLEHRLYGSSNSFTVVSNVDASLPRSTGIGTTELTGQGVDVAGTIGGYAATGTGQVLIGGAGTPVEGLTLRVTLSASELALQRSAQGSIMLSRGIGAVLEESLDFIVDPYEGIVKSNQDLYRGLIRDIDERIEVLEERLSRQEELWRKQFVALEEALAAFQTQGAWLTQQLASLSALTQSSSNQGS